jgi:uncharacterized protein with HEPN domain
MKKRRSPEAYLWDIEGACRLVAQFIAGQSLASYTADALVSSAVERQLSIIGEAITQLSKLYPEYAASFPERNAIIGFRNRLIHDYEETATAIVWAIALDDVPRMHAKVKALLGDPQP